MNLDDGGKMLQAQKAKMSIFPFYLDSEQIFDPSKSGATAIEKYKNVLFFFILGRLQGVLLLQEYGQGIVCAFSVKGFLI